MSISDERLAETVARLQKIIDYFDAEANEALAGQTERGDLWSDIEIPVADLRVLISVASQLRAAAPSGDEVEAAARAMCIEGGFDPDEMMPNDGPRWRYYVPGASAALSAAAKVRAGREGEFAALKASILRLTAKGEALAGWIEPSANSSTSASQARDISAWQAEKDIAFRLALSTQEGK